MTIFCFLWMPLFYLFRRSLVDETGSGAVWALILGSAVALAQFFLGSFIDPGGFGLSRWISGMVDIVVLPVLLPLLVYLFFVIFRISSSGPADFANFTLLWLIPGGGLRAVGWSATNDPTLLVLVPLLWTALAIGIPFFIDCMMRFLRWYVIIPCGLGILVLPFLAATSWWAFYSQITLYGVVFSALTAVPLIISMILALRRAS
jgi:hypothetical protein